MAKRLGFILAFILGVSPSFAFDVDGFRTGMSKAEVTSWTTLRGREVRVQKNDPNSWSVGKFDEGQIDATLYFCEERLIHCGHNIDFDTDLTSRTQLFNEKYGQPKKVETQTQQLNGVSLASVYLYWYSGQDRMVLGFSPQIRNSAGEIKISRAASISFASKNECWPQW